MIKCGDLDIKKTHVKYESPISSTSKAMTKVKILEKWVMLQG